MSAKGLGRGLEALLGEVKKAEKVLPQSTQGLQWLSTEALQPGAYQPRVMQVDAALLELVESIRQHGVLQPLIVRPLSENHYEIIAGERRFQAAKRAGLSQIPCVIRPLSNRDALAVGLVENVQRADLNLIEQAKALGRLMEEFGLTQAQAADLVGKSRPMISHLTRLLQLPERIQQHVVAGELELGHAKLLLTLPTAMQLQLDSLIIENQWSVRQTEAYLKKQGSSTEKKPKPETPPWEHDVLQLNRQLQEKTGLDICIHAKEASKGEVRLRYDNLEILDKILAYFEH